VFLFVPGKLCTYERDTMDGAWSMVSDWVIFLQINLLIVNHLSQWPRCLRNELFSPTRMQSLWVRIPLEVWLSVCAFILFVRMLTYVQVEALRPADLPSKGFYRLFVRWRISESGQSPITGSYKLMMIIIIIIMIIIMVDYGNQKTVKCWSSLIIVAGALKSTQLIQHC
jgi:hypothetical protein